MMKNILFTLALISSASSFATDKLAIKSFTTFNAEVFNIQKDIKELKVVKQYPFIKEATLKNGQIIDASEISKILIDRARKGVDGGGGFSDLIQSGGDLGGGISNRRLLGDGSGG
ncbi:hypothetical protein DAY19_11745 [Halobacteriovorax vibrionivorans]|uniref:Uncharacterized protein n=1 Tax=Halobacteriovorax vibrionivorans TaxID=2152716 RepID=A0ABY0ICH3_9BACT|nr:MULTISPECIES: hypothetical protein [Halobacteriovorax]RZF20651.1 hypothetical protein DAY19_11745 [Halobacteriovorax vibrionivorans]TGD48939.1 hypothetical protein EP118_01985 [Halobacteriovorax sp. Y22]